MTFRTANLVGAVLLLAACSDGESINGPAMDGTHLISLSFSTRSIVQSGLAAAPHVASAAADTLADGTNTLTLDRVQVVLREIELDRIGIGGCDSTRGVDDCEEFEVGPILIDLPLDGGTAHMLTVPVDTGTYDEIEFEIHKVDDDDPEDAAFREAHPDFIGTSIRARGSYNGVSFVFETDLGAEQEFLLIPPLRIDEGTTVANVTVRFDVSQWFVDASGALLNPQTANKGGPNEHVVEENIERSIEAFGDDDRDGDDDK